MYKSVLITQNITSFMLLRVPISEKCAWKLKYHTTTTRWCVLVLTEKAKVASKGAHDSGQYCEGCLRREPLPTWLVNLGFPKFFWQIRLICWNTGPWTICVQLLELYKNITVQPFELFMSHTWHVQELDTFKYVMLTNITWQSTN